MTTIHSSPMHFIPPGTIGDIGNIITQIDDMGNTAFLPPAAPILPPNGIQIYYSKQIGIDAPGRGSATQPYASINYAYSSVASPTEPVFITGLDGEIYDEQLVLDNSLKYIAGGRTNLQYTGSGDAITIVAMGAGFPIEFSTVSAATGNAIVNTQSEIVILEIGALLQGNVVNSGSGNIGINAQIVTVDLVNESDTGYIYFNIGARLSGVNTGPNIIGLSPVNEMAFKAYVSKYNGNDSNNGTYTNQFQTIGAAYAFLEGVSEAAQVVITDNATYFENLVFDNGLISLIGPQATVTQGGDADTINCTFSGSSIQIVLAGLNNFTDNSALHCSGDNAVFLQVGAIEAGVITQDGSDGVISILAQQLDCDMICTSTGTINYVSAERTGTDTPGSGQINGVHPNMPVSLPFNGSQIYFSQVAGNDSWSASLTNPVATINQAITIWGSYPNATIIGLDNANYDEQITTVSGMTIYAPAANISSSVGDTITNNGSGVTVTFNTIQSSGGNAITNIGGYPTFNFIACFGGDFVNVSGGIMTLNATTIQTNISNPGYGSHGSTTVLTLLEGPPGSVDAYTYSAWSNSLPIFGVTEAFNTLVPWTSFQYFTWYEGNNAWFPAGAQNSPPFPQPTLPANFGSTNLFVPFAGTYQFTVVTITTPDAAILHFNINGVDTYVDAYAASSDGISYVWTQALVAGNNIIALDALTKNPSSSDYQVRLRLAGLMVASV